MTAPTDDAEHAATHTRTHALWQKALLGFSVVVVVLLLSVGGWVGANVMLRGPRTELLWTETALPALPAEADNGWITFSEGMRSFASPSLDPDLTDLCDVKGHGGASAAWREVRSSEGKIVEAVTDPINRKRLDVMRRSFAKPAFADACPHDFEVDCRWIALFHAHRLGEVAVLNRALDGAWDDAFSETKRMVRVDFAFTRSSRSLLSQMVGLRISSQVLDMLDVLLAGYREQGKLGARHDADASTLRALDVALSSLKRSELSMRRCVVGEYLYAVNAFEAMARSPAKAGIAPRLGPVAGFLLDRDDTLRMLNDEFRSVMAYAEKPSGPPPPTPRNHAQGSFWWARNPIGKLGLDLGRPNMVPMIRKGARLADDLIARRDALRTLLASIPQPSPRAEKP